MAKQAQINYLTTDDNVRIRYRIDQPAAMPRGSILLLQGRGEALEKYEEITAGLVERGFSVFSFDWRGQGLSERLLADREKSHVESFDDYLHDLDLFLRHIWQPAATNFIIAHSMGAHLALRYCAEHAFEVNGVLLCAPMIDIKTRRWPRQIAPVVVGGMVGLGMADSYVPGSRPYLPTDRKFVDNPLTGDPVRFERFPTLLRQRPELAVGGPTLGWVKAAFDSIEVTQRPGYLERIDCPVYVLVGDGDLIIDLEAARQLCRRLPRPQFEVVENARHEIMLEQDDVCHRFWHAFDHLVDQETAVLSL